MIMIVIGPLLLLLSGMLMIFSAGDREWETVHTEKDFYREGSGEYSVYAMGTELENEMRVTIISKDGESVSVSFRVEESWGSEVYSNSGMTPETYEFHLDSTTFLDEYEIHIDIGTDGYTIEDLDVDLQKKGIPDSFLFFCLGGSIIGLLGLTLMVLGIIFTAVYSHKITQQSPEYIREEMLRRQEVLAQEQQAKRAREMDMIRQRQAMLIRARNLEASYRLDEAAFMYERLDMYEDARRCRSKLREEVSRNTHLNANQLFDLLQQRGTAIPYLCQRCHGMLDIDGINNRHTRCPYCGADVDFETLRKAARNLLV